MFRSRFSASAESFLSSASSEDCQCLECEQIHPLARRPSFFRRSFPSLNKLHIPAAPLHHTLSSPVTLQKHKAQMTSMGYSRLFNLGYFSVTDALQSSG
ncbi:hypothetical protein BDM02DRAFT_3187612 [Thelephora ganbajun]|uniref:Uncharacterized protein n=1 Tax=Thelephora ganbajun TaxID=370292 RepID=A0ACB6ZEP8_THEGA|nr:hypothetical protein BDM02DRAFT_3187612 [Thelephora ganbajun]